MRELSVPDGSLLDVEVGRHVMVGNDSYRVEQLHQGGMAFVALLERQVTAVKKFTFWLPKSIAVKVPLKANDSLKGELQRWSLMTHHNIVMLKEILFYREAGSLAAVAEEFDGSLRDIVKRMHPFNEVEAYQVIRSCAEALLYAYEVHSVLHLDVKPENVLFKPQTPSGQRQGGGDVTSARIILDSDFLLADWGISSSKLSMLSNSYNGEWVKTHNNSGTIPYMAPERYLKGWRSSPASDIFSLGIMWVELLCGRLPYDLAQDVPMQILRGEYFERAADLLAASDATRTTRQLILDFIAPNPNKRTNCWQKAIRRIRPGLMTRLLS